ncbi:4502_t:CDS:2 [Rhizophagus irregularis]|nr:4502_t:CDS:2 [Rhizophagus irregularis]
MPDMVKFRHTLDTLDLSSSINSDGKSIVWDLCLKFGITEGTVQLFTFRITLTLKSLKSHVIIWPHDDYYQEVRREFEEKCKFPNVIGVLDGSHINLFETSKQDYVLTDSAYPISTTIITSFKNITDRTRNKNTKLDTDIIEISLILHNIIQQCNDIWESSGQMVIYQMQHDANNNLRYF